MPAVLVYHDISKSAEHWLTSPKREEVFGPIGVTSIRTFVHPQDSTKVGLVFDASNMDAVGSSAIATISSSSIGSPKRRLTSRRTGSVRSSASPVCRE